MKKLTAVLAALVGVASIAGAEELSLSATLAYESDYIFRGKRLANEYIAPSVDLSYGEYYLGAWAAIPFEDGDETEVDLYAGFATELSEVMNLDLGVTLYTYPQVGNASNTLEIFSGLSFDVPLSPAIYAAYDIDLKAFTIEGSCGYSIPVGESNSFDLSGYFGLVDVDIGESYSYYGVGVAYNVAISEAVSASVGVNYYGASEDMEADGSRSKITFGASVTTGF